MQQYAAVSAVEALGLTFGAVDLIVGDDGHTYILEVNTAPACSPRTAREYVNAVVVLGNQHGFDIRPDYTALEQLRDVHDDDLED